MHVPQVKWIYCMCEPTMQRKRKLLCVCTRCVIALFWCCTCFGISNVDQKSTRLHVNWQITLLISCAYLLSDKICEVFACAVCFICSHVLTKHKHKHNDERTNNYCTRKSAPRSMNLMKRRLNRYHWTKIYFSSLFGIDCVWAHVCACVNNLYKQK